MASMWQKVTVYLGLGPDDGFEDTESIEERPTSHAPLQSRSTSTRPVAARPTEGVGVVRTIPASSNSNSSPNPAPRRPMVVAEDPKPRPMRAPDPKPAIDNSVVRPIRPAATPATIEPHSFNDAQHMADKFLSRQPVIVNLQGAEQALSRRLIDFASGLCYGMGGQMTKVANHVYLLTPPDMEVPSGDQLRLQSDD